MHIYYNIHNVPNVELDKVLSVYVACLSVSPLAPSAPTLGQRPPWASQLLLLPLFNLLRLPCPSPRIARVPDPGFSPLLEPPPSPSPNAYLLYANSMKCQRKLTKLFEIMLAKSCQGIAAEAALCFCFVTSSLNAAINLYHENYLGQLALLNASNIPWNMEIISLTRIKS